jgi:CHAT domain-containing protein
VGRLSEPYRVLARLLLDQGRVAEGERVLLALKEVEFFDYVRGEGEASASAEVALTADEARVLTEVNGLVEPMTRLFAQMQQHLQGEKPLSDDDLANLQDRQNQLNLRLQAELARIDARLKKPEATAVAPLVLDSKLADLVERLAAPPLGEDAVALAFVPEDNVTTVVITTRGQPTVLQLPVGLAVLDPLVRELRAAIRDKGDHLPSARALHRYLVRPVEQELTRQKLAPKTWMLFLTDKLRYMPFAALVGPDGKHVIESHQLAVLTAPSLDQMTVPPLPNWSVRAFGSTAAVPSQNLSALPGARDELRHIVRSAQNPDGILPGQALLDDDFTRPAWLAIFRQGAAPAPAYGVVHVASHFNALAGDWGGSFLVLGGGDLYRMSELSAASQLKLGHLDLITLAACATEVNDQGNGRELEGMGVMLQKRGARAVIGTLWTVQDEGSAALMQAFYRAHGEQRRMSKAAALQSAQLDLLQGRVVSSNPAVSLKHPYYWAPFLLMGNWL